MADVKEASDEAAKRLEKAVINNDGITAPRILEEVGSCGWSSLIKKTNALAMDNKDGFVLVPSSALEIYSTSETLSLSKTTPVEYGLGTPMTAWVNPMGSISDTRCEKK